MRRVVVKGDLTLYQYNSGQWAGYASGGYMADSIITGTVYSGSQQQWITRNSQIGVWTGGVWNMVYVGCQGGPSDHCGHQNGFPVTTSPSSPAIAEKPYITINSDGTYTLLVPPVETNKVGPTTNYDAATKIDFSNVFVATDQDTAATINGKLGAGIHVVLCPGTYRLEDSIKVTQANTVLLALGLADVYAPSNGAPAVVVSNVDGVRIAGLLLDASQTGSSSLLQWGNGTYAGSSSNPGVLSDIFTRVGGMNNPSQYQVKVDSTLEINSGNVIIDDTWLWRADHDITGLVYNSNNPSKNGIIVNGDNVVAYGLASEHHLENLVEWNGNNGKTFFYQSEFPYDVTQANYGDMGYSGYVVADGVTGHTAYGVGVYSYFRDNSVTVQNAIRTGSSTGVSFTNSLSVFLNGKGAIEHVIDGQGSVVAGVNQQEYVCSFSA